MFFRGTSAPTAMQAVTAVVALSASELYSRGLIRRRLTHLLVLTNAYYRSADTSMVVWVFFLVFVPSLSWQIISSEYATHFEICARRRWEQHDFAPAAGDSRGP